MQSVSVLTSLTLPVIASAPCAGLPWPQHCSAFARDTRSFDRSRHSLAGPAKSMIRQSQRTVSLPPCRPGLSDRSKLTQAAGRKPAHWPAPSRTVQPACRIPARKSQLSPFHPSWLRSWPSTFCTCCTSSDSSIRPLPLASPLRSASSTSQAKNSVPLAGGANHTFNPRAAVVPVCT